MMIECLLNYNLAHFCCNLVKNAKVFMLTMKGGQNSIQSLNGPHDLASQAQRYLHISCSQNAPMYVCILLYIILI